MYPDAVPTRQAPASSDTYALEIWNRLTLVELNPQEAGTINLTIDAECPDGAQIIVDVNQDATGRAITMGSGIEGDDLGGVANDKVTIVMVYNKTAGNFRVVSIYNTVDAAP